MRQPYQPGNASTGVLAFELVPGGIIVEFRNHGRYLYTTTRPGPDHVAEMIRLALAGRGLSTYVSQQVQDRYAEKLGT